MPRVLVTGGTGFVGSHTVETFLQDGWTVCALVRDRNRLAWLNGLQIQFAEGSLTDSRSLAAACDGCDVVVHCAAMTKAVDPRDMFRVNAVAVGEFVKTAREKGVRRFVLCSTQAAAGPAVDGRARTEDDPPQPISQYGLSKLEGEQLLKDQAGAMEWVVLRPPTVIGPRDLQFVPLFRGITRYGLFPRFGNGKQTYSFLSVRDLARVLVFAAQVNTGLNEIYFAAHDEALDWSQAAMVLADLAGRNVRPLTLNRPLLTMVGGFAEFKAKLTGKPALLGFEKIREILSPDWTCSTEKIRRNWGFKFEWSRDRTLRDTFEAYRDAKWL
jgi:dihydroflavonol-4-reductase